MPSGPYRDRVFPPAEVRRILRRAAEIEDAGAGRARSASGRGHSAEEIERIAADAGISPDALARAIDGEVAPPSGAKMSVHLAGAPDHVTIARTVRGVIGDGGAGDLARVMRAAVGDLGAVQVDGRALTWSTSGRSGRIVHAVVERAGEGEVSIRVDENLRPYRARHTSIAAAIGGIGMCILVAPIAAVLGPGAIPAFLLVWFLLVVGLARSKYAVAFRAREAELRDVAGEIAGFLRTSGPRVADEVLASGTARVADAGVDDEADAEPYEAGEEARRRPASR
jgi:hypothetical protein